MTRPDRELIAQVMLFSQGFRTAESLAQRLSHSSTSVSNCHPNLTTIFGLRALKAVLASAGILKRERLQQSRLHSDNNVAALSDEVSEQIILIQNNRAQNGGRRCTTFDKVMQNG